MNPSLFSAATAAFHEETLEALRAIESWVLISSQDFVAGKNQQQETRRQLHSLKGTATSFGYEPISQICHAIEGVLQADSQLAPQQSDAILTALDYCRQLSSDELTPAQSVERLTSCLAKLNQYRQTGIEPVIPPQVSGSVWQIEFTPHQQFFENGHDPLRILRALREFGPIKVAVFTEKLPDFADFDPFQCYLRWQITLKAELDYNALAAQFEWVKHVCDLNIEVLASSQPERLARSSRYKLSETHINALLTISQNLQSQLQQTVPLINQLEPTDNIRLSRRNQAMKRQQQLLQQQLLHITMRPLADAFARLPRMAFDVAQKTQKLVQLHMHISPIELDSLIIHSLMDPLTHLLRNAVVHGIETPEQRQLAGKASKGQIHISAEQVDEQLLIRFSDDGRGLAEQQILTKAKQLGINTGDIVNNRQLNEWIFQSGFSTASAVDDLSGRGVGLDVVKQHITDLGGNIELVSTRGKGCCFTFYIPIQQSLVDSQIVQIDHQKLVLPLLNILDSYPLESNRQIWQRGKQWFITDDNRQVPLVNLRKFLQLAPDNDDIDSAFIILLNTENTLFAVLVDSLAEQAQLLIKSLQPHYRHINGIKGVALLPEGHLALLLDPSKLLEYFHSLGGH